MEDHTVLCIELEGGATWRLWPWGFQEVEAPRFHGNWHMEVVGCQSYAPAALTPRRYPGIHFCRRLSQPGGHSAAARIMPIKNSRENIGNRARDLPVCKAVPLPTEPPQFLNYFAHFSWRGHWGCVLKGRKYTWLNYSWSVWQMVLMLKPSWRLLR